jgi:hypothetical protein
MIVLVAFSHRDVLLRPVWWLLLLLLLLSFDLTRLTDLKVWYYFYIGAT